MNDISEKLDDIKSLLCEVMDYFIKIETQLNDFQIPSGMIADEI